MTMYKGLVLETGLNKRIAAAELYVSDKPHLRVFLDPESMEPSIVTKEWMEGYLANLEAAKPKLNTKSAPICIFGTGGKI